jgi:hypothetical protein
VVARLYDRREVEAKVTRIVDSVAGRKVHIAYGLIALKIDPEQIIREVQGWGKEYPAMIGYPAAEVVHV